MTLDALADLRKRAEQWLEMPKYTNRADIKLIREMLAALTEQTQENAANYQRALAAETADDEACSECARLEAELTRLRQELFVIRDAARPVDIQYAENRLAALRGQPQEPK